MARYRTIKPEFWTSEQIMECSANARLLFIGMWNFADDAGRIPLSPKTLKAQIYPGDDITPESVRGMIVELSSNGLVDQYTVDNKEYLQITGWHHQKIDRPQKAKYPDPHPDHSSNDRRTVAPERKKEGKGIEREDAAAAAPDSDEKQLFDLGKQILGTSSGGLLKKLVAAKDGSIPLARAALEVSRTKSNPREYLGAIIRSREDAECRPDRSF